MKRTLLVTLALACAAAPGFAHAQRIAPMKAGNFARLCTRATSAGICDAYIGGLTDGVSLSKINDRNEGDPSAPAGFCVPTTETMPVMRSKVLAWLKAHSETLDKPVGESVFAALHASYPCSVKK